MILPVLIFPEKTNILSKDRSAILNRDLLKSLIKKYVYIIKLIFFYRIALKYNDKFCFHLCHFDSTSWQLSMVTGVSKTYITIKYFVLVQCAFRKLIFELNIEHDKFGKPLYAA